MLTLCYYETDAQLIRLMETVEFSDAKLIHHTEVKSLIAETIRATRTMLSSLGVLPEDENFQVFELEQFKAVIDRMIKLDEHRVYAVQVSYVEEGFLDTKAVVPKPVIGDWLPSVTSIGGIHQLLLLKEDAVDRVLMHAVVQ